MHRPLHVSAVSIFAALLFAGPASAGGDNIHEGEWEITTQMSIQGMPFVPKPVTRTQCITRKDAVPKPAQEQGKCDISTTKTEGNKVSWQVKCEKGPNDSAEGSGEITYSGDS